MKIVDSRRRYGSPLLIVLLAFGGAGLATFGSNSVADTSFELQDYRGKVVVLDFWASWCVPCRHSFPWMNQMQQKYAGDGLVIIGVNMDANADDAAAFLNDYPAEFVIVPDSRGELATRFAIEAMPSSFVIDREGNVVASHLGFQSRKTDEYEANIKQVLFIKED
jgi:thiol-disulfide isomerase/thioredoxin